MRPLRSPLAATTLLAALLLAFSSAPSSAAGAPGDDQEENPLTAAATLLKSGDHGKRIDGLKKLVQAGPSKRAEKLALGALADPDWAVVIEAARTAGAVGAEDARDALVRLSLEGPIRWIRDAAADGLRTLDAPGSSKQLLGIARKVQDESVRVPALQALGRIGDPASLDGVKVFARRREIDVAAAAVEAMAAIGTGEGQAETVVGELTKLLGLRKERRNFRAYAAAVTALARFDDERAREAVLEELLQQVDEDGYIGERIARGLATQPADSVASSFSSVLSKARKPVHLRMLLRVAARVPVTGARAQVEGLLEHSAPRVRSEAARALGAMGDPAAVESLRALLRDKDTFVRREVVTALAALMTPPAFLELASVVGPDKNPDVRLQYVVDLVEKGDPSAIETLQGFSGDRNWRVASAAVVSIGTLGVAADLDRVRPLLEDRDWKLRAAAFEATGRLRAEAAIPLLTEGLRDRDPVVRGVCLANLQILTREKLSASPEPWRKWYAENAGKTNLVKRSRRSQAEKDKEAKEQETRYAHEIREYGVEVLQKARILVVEGAWDKAQRVLDHLDIKHTLLRAQELKKAGLNPNQVVLVNCEGNVDKDSAERLQWFVNVGGYIMSTDWALTKAIQTCFPDYAVQFSGSNTGNDVVVVEDAMPGHPYTRGVFENVPAMMWWLEIQAFPIRVNYPERCDVIVDSAVMRQRYGSSPMAVAFSWGLGRVQHSLSHFFLQEEGMTQARSAEARKVFAADNLGLSLDQIRNLDAKGAFSGNLNEETMKEIAPDYSMFRLIVNVVAEKEEWVENL